MIVLDLSILNQKGTPMFNSDIFANRPAFGIVGRIFISTDTKEFFRDTGTSWELIGGPGSGTITGSGTVGTLPIWTTTSALGDSTLIEGATLISTTKDFKADAFYLTGAAASNGALYWISDRVTLANYNVGGSVEIMVNGGAAAQTIAANLSTTFYGNIIRNGGTSSQFLKADGSLDSTTYISTNIYNGDGTLTANRVVSDGGFGLSFTSTTHIGSAAIGGGGNGKLIVGSSTADNGIQVFGANAPSFRIDNAQSGGTQRFVFGLATATNNFIQGATAGEFCISTQSAGNMLFGMWQTINASEVMRITTTNNLLIGSSVDGGQRLQVTGSARATGYFLDGMTAGSGALYFSSGTNRVTLANYNAGGILLFEVNGGTTALTLNSDTSAQFASSVNANSNIFASGVGNITIKAASSDNFPLFQLVDSRVGGTTWNIEGGRTLGNLQIRSSIAGASVLEILSTGEVKFFYNIEINNSVAVAVAAPSTHKVAILIGGVQYYLLASNV